MEKKYADLYVEAVQLNDKVKDAICECMKPLRYIEFNTLHEFPFKDCYGNVYPVEVKSLRYTEEGDVAAVTKSGHEWSIQNDGLIETCLELLFYLETEAYNY